MAAATTVQMSLYLSDILQVVINVIFVKYCNNFNFYSLGGSWSQSCRHYTGVQF